MNSFQVTDVDSWKEMPSLLFKGWQGSAYELAHSLASTWNHPVHTGQCGIAKVTPASKEPLGLFHINNTALLHVTLARKRKSVFVIHTVLK